MNVFQAEGYLMLLVQFILLAVKIFAFVSCLLFSAESYVAAGKLTKVAWAAILGLGVVIAIAPVGMPFFIGLGFTIAALVYLADARPALSSLNGR